MSQIEPRKRGGLRTVDRALAVAGVVGGIFVILWVVSAVGHLVLDAFKIVILVVVVALVVRLIHLFTRGRRG